MRVLGKGRHIESDDQERLPEEKQSKWSLTYRVSRNYSVQV